jgi:hypothetical protein
MLTTLLLAFLMLQQAQTGTLQVLVHVAGTSKPISGVEVILSGPQTARATTDGSGRVAFSNLPMGGYGIQTRREGYFRKDESGNPLIGIPMALRIRSIESADYVAIFPAQLSPSFSIAMVPLGSINGRVKSADGTPLRDAVVTASVIEFQDGRRILAEGNKAQTNAAGEYSLPMLAPGEYYLRVNPQDATRTHLGTYYPGETDLRKATLITIGGGEEVGGIDFDLVTPKTFVVSGRVLNAPKRTLQDGRTEIGIPSLALVPRDPDTPDFPSPVRLVNEFAATDGDFLIRGVPAGSWDLIPVITLELRGIREQRLIIDRIPIDVVDRDINGLAITLRSASIKGVTMMTGGERVPIPLRAMLIPRDNMPRNYLSHVTAARTLGFLDGAFVFEPVPPGQYNFQFEEIPAGYHLADLRLGSRSIYDDGIIDVNTAPLEPLEVVLGQGGARINGKIQGLVPSESNLEHKFIRVALVPARRKNFALYQTATLSPDGSFSFSYVAPGLYKVFAWKNLPNGAEKSEDFIARYEAFGTSVSTAAGVTNSITVLTIPEDR